MADPDHTASSSASTARPGPDTARDSSGWPTEARVFLVLGVFAVVINVIYIVMSLPGGIEWAGTVGLAACAVFSLYFAYFLHRSLRTVQRDVEEVEEQVEAGELHEDSPQALYLPETSIWPLGIGLGCGLTFAGLGFGWWFMLPGIALLLHSAIGFAHQSRDRRRD